MRRGYFGWLEMEGRGYWRGVKEYEGTEDHESV